MTKPKRIPRAVLAEAVKKAGTFHGAHVRPTVRVLGHPTSIFTLSSSRFNSMGLDENPHAVLHYSFHTVCMNLTPNDFVECWSGDVNNPTVRRHKVGNCRVKV